MYLVWNVWNQSSASSSVGSTSRGRGYAKDEEELDAGVMGADLF